MKNRIFILLISTFAFQGFTQQQPDTVYNRTSPIKTITFYCQNLCIEAATSPQIYLIKPHGTQVWLLPENKVSHISTEYIDKQMNTSLNWNRERICSNQEDNKFDMTLLKLNSSALATYGIPRGLANAKEEESQNLVRYNQPDFNTATLHKEEVVNNILKQFRRERFDFSGILQDIVRPDINPF